MTNYEFMYDLAIWMGVTLVGMFVAIIVGYLLESIFDRD